MGTQSKGGTYFRVLTMSGRFVLVLVFTIYAFTCTAAPETDAVVPETDFLEDVLPVADDAQELVRSLKLEEVQEMGSCGCTDGKSYSFTTVENLLADAATEDDDVFIQDKHDLDHSIEEMVQAGAVLKGKPCTQWVKSGEKKWCTVLSGCSASTGIKKGTVDNLVLGSKCVPFCDTGSKKMAKYKRCKTSVEGARLHKVREGKNKSNKKSELNQKALDAKTAAKAKEAAAKEGLKTNKEAQHKAKEIQQADNELNTKAGKATKEEKDAKASNKKEAGVKATKAASEIAAKKNKADSEERAAKKAEKAEKTVEKGTKEAADKAKAKEAAAAEAKEKFNSNKEKAKKSYQESNKKGLAALEKKKKAKEEKAAKKAEKDKKKEEERKQKAIAAEKAAKAKERDDKAAKAKERAAKDEKKEKEKAAKEKSAKERASKAESSAKTAERSDKERNSKEQSTKAAAKESNDKAAAERSTKERTDKQYIPNGGCCCFAHFGCFGSKSCRFCRGGNHHVWPWKCGTSRKCNR